MKLTSKTSPSSQHKHTFKRVAVKQESDNPEYNKGVPPMILKQKCTSCGYSYAYDLMSRKEFYEQLNARKTEENVPDTD